MKKFSKIVVNKDVEVLGEGYYQKFEDEIFVEASDSKVKRAFDEMLDQRVIISSIKFEGLDGSFGGYTGPYFIRSIQDNEITLQK
ncbi:hypothetical protein [Bacillus haynesii]|uniref:hypothetical protein n=1 Tax=Bacillus haynesii TaxID=1925021 RepID=UPI00227F1A62|nr:hypothetical protein [Bacillus haynesii]MCY7990965.1 hypothetical protein [Bacillus haynesii]